MDIILSFLAKSVDKHSITLVHITYLPLISSQMAEFLLFFRAKSCEVSSVILLPWQQLKMQQTGFTCKMCFKVLSLKSDDTLSRFRMVEEKQEGGVSPSGKIGLNHLSAHFA